MLIITENSYCDHPYAFGNVKLTIASEQMFHILFVIYWFLGFPQEWQFRVNNPTLLLLYFYKSILLTVLSTHLM